MPNYTYQCTVCKKQIELKSPITEVKGQVPCSRDACRGTAFLTFGGGSGFTTPGDGFYGTGRFD